MKYLPLILHFYVGDSKFFDDFVGVPLNVGGITGMMVKIEENVISEEVNQINQSFIITIL